MYMKTNEQKSAGPMPDTAPTTGEGAPCKGMYSNGEDLEKAVTGKQHAETLGRSKAHTGMVSHVRSNSLWHDDTCQECTSEATGHFQDLPKY